MKNIKIPFLRLTIFTLVVTGVVWGIHNFMPHFVYPRVAYLLGFFYALFLFTGFLAEMAMIKASEKSAVILHLVVNVIRIILCLFAVFFFLYFDTDNSGLLVINFLILYLCYFGFEIYFLLSNLRPHLKR